MNYEEIKEKHRWLSVKCHKEIFSVEMCSDEFFWLFLLNENSLIEFEGPLILAYSLVFLGFYLELVHLWGFETGKPPKYGLRLRFYLCDTVWPIRILFLVL